MGITRRQRLRRASAAIRSRSREDARAMRRSASLTYLPGNRSRVFDTPLVPVGTLVAVALHRQHNRTAEGRPVEQHMFRGYTAALEVDATTTFTAVTNKFAYDGWFTPAEKPRGRTLPAKNLDLVETYQDLDQAARWASRRNEPLSGQPEFPRTYLAFRRTQTPNYGVTPFVRRVAQERGIWPEEALAALQAELRFPEFRNTTGFTLVDARLCPSAEGALRAFHDVESLLGRRTRNPRGISPRGWFGFATPLAGYCGRPAWRRCRLICLRSGRNSSSGS